GERADLIDLDQNCVGDAALDPLRENRRVGDEDVVANQLRDRAEGSGELGPTVPVTFGQTVLDRDDRVLAAKLAVVRDHLIRRLLSAFEVVYPFGSAQGRLVE